MKKIVLVLMLFLLSAVYCLGGASQSLDYMRIHVRANSNDNIDQTIKMQVKDEIVDYMRKQLLNVRTIDESVDIAINQLDNVEDVANNYLAVNNLPYKATVSYCEEYFPERMYNGIVLKSGEYKTLLVELGEGVGDNWWCVVYPPLCFVGGEPIENEGIVYKSKIKEILNWR